MHRFFFSYFDWLKEGTSLKKALDRNNSALLPLLLCKSALHEALTAPHHIKIRWSISKKLHTVGFKICSAQSDAGELKIVIC